MIRLSKEEFNTIKEFVKQSGEHLSGCLKWNEWDHIHDLHEKAVRAVKAGLEVGEKKRKPVKIPQFAGMEEQFPEFFNTTNESGKELKKAKEKAGKQNKLVLKVFDSEARFGFNTGCTASDVLSAQIIRETGAPITSIRRAISTLTDEGKLKKTEEKRMGPHGRNEYVWRLV